MNTLFTMTSLKKDGFRWALSVAAAGLLGLTSRAYCDDPLTMVPPIEATSTQSTNDAPANVSPDTVFKWSEVPESQEVPIQRAVFDQGGYQLYDTVGETIVVPFTNHNLYVMKFGLSTNGKTYFVNEGDVPVLYVPQECHLENATVPGARWYPFSEKYQPSHPVFLGVAPSWTDYVDMGWYPGMYCHGGYWCETSYVSGGLFLPTFGLFFVIGGHHYDGWHRYHDYCDYHPAPYRTEYFHRDIYRWSDRPYWAARPFEGAGHRDRDYRAFGGDRSNSGDRGYLPHRTLSGDHPINNDNRPINSGRPLGTFRTNSGSTDRRSNSFGQGRTFRGAGPFERGQDAGRTYGSNHFNNGERAGSQGRSGDDSRPSGGRTFGGGQPSFGSRDHTDRSGQPTENNRIFSGGRSYSSGRDHSSSGQDHSYRWTEGNRTNSSNDHANRSFGSDRSSNGNNRSSSGSDHSSRAGDDHSGGRGGFRSR